MPKKIIQKENPLLREISKPVPIQDIKSTKIQNILKEMRISLDSQDDGVAIAAPQIGYSLRIFIVSKRVDDIVKKSKRRKLDVSEKDSNEDGTEMKNLTDLVFINPVIKKLSKEKKIMEEGCLSVRYLYGEVKRSNKATVEAYDQNGNKFERGGTGLLAQIFQHEIDHLDGILFIDKAKNVEEIPPEQIISKDEK